MVDWKFVGVFFPDCIALFCQRKRGSNQTSVAFLGAFAKHLGKRLSLRASFRRPHATARLLPQIFVKIKFFYIYIQILAQIWQKHRHCTRRPKCIYDISPYVFFVRYDLNPKTVALHTSITVEHDRLKICSNLWRKIAVRKGRFFIKYQEFKILLHTQHHLYHLFRQIAGFLIETNYGFCEVRNEVQENLIIIT